MVWNEVNWGICGDCVQMILECPVCHGTLIYAGLRVDMGKVYRDYICSVCVRPFRSRGTKEDMKVAKYFKMDKVKCDG